MKCVWGISCLTVLPSPPRAEALRVLLPYDGWSWGFVWYCSEDKSYWLHPAQASEGIGRCDRSLRRYSAWLRWYGDLDKLRWGLPRRWVHRELEDSRNRDERRELRTRVPIHPWIRWRRDLRAVHEAIPFRELDEQGSVGLDPWGVHEDVRLLSWFHVHPRIGVPALARSEITLPSSVLLLLARQQAWH